MVQRVLKLISGSFLVNAALVATTWAQDGRGQYRPEIKGPTSEGREAMAGFVLPEGFSASLFASEPLLANPVCFAIGPDMAFYVAETFRLHAGVTDMRSRMSWLDDELACRTVEDRVEMMRKHEGEAFERKYAQEHERLRLIRDKNGDGIADTSTVFADGFSHPAMGIAAGILPVKGDIYYACIPDMWVLRDQDGDDRADQRQSQHTGWGVHIALLGHDMHGIQRGPDGRLYWSIGDRGFHVEHEGKVHAHHHAGAVLRSELDGSGLEVFATGLRNPQEMTFDDRGNLFTGDNNSDAGDRARWVYVVEGGEVGWRHAYQYVNWPNRRGPWNAEKEWQPHHPGQPAYLLPPIANFADGPSGLTYYPGTGWGPSWRGTFFLCDFRGGASASGVHAFRMAPKGAGFDLVDAERFLWNSLVTDVDFAPDGNMYVSDWVSGWGMTGKGRIYRISSESGEFADERAEIQALLGAGMTERPDSELVRLLDHGHRQVRLEAQWELAERAVNSTGDDAWRPHLLGLMELVGSPTAPQFPRLHALWGLGHAARLRPDIATTALPVALSAVTDPDPELRAQALKVLGDLRWTGVAEAALSGLEDPEARVRGFAAEAVGKIRLDQAFDSILEQLEATGESDPWLRHQLIWALVGIGDGERLAGLAGDERMAVRMGATVALRRLEDPRIGAFLADPDPLVVAEAARAIYDAPIPGAMAALAGLLERLPLGSDPYLVRRALNACRTGGTERDAQRVVSRFALGDRYATEAVRILAEWDRPGSRDPIGGDWRPHEERNVDPMARYAGPMAAAAGSFPDDAARDYARALEARGPGPHAPVAGSALDRILRDTNRAADARVAALRALVRMEASEATAALDYGAADADASVRTASFDAMAARDPVRALELLADIVRREASGENARQQAVRAIAGIDHPDVPVLIRQFIRSDAASGKPSSITLELLEAGEASTDPGVQAALNALGKAMDSSGDGLGKWGYALSGGNVAAGREVFLSKSETSCLRCHAYGAEGGSEVGPDLTDVGSRLEPLDLLRSIVDPNAEVAEEYQNWLFSLRDGEVVVGRVLERGESILVETPQKEAVRFLASEVEASREDLSSMPQDVSSHLSRTELRDLMAFLLSSR